MAATSLLIASSASQGINSFGTAYNQSKATAAAGDYNAKMMELNAKLADYQGEDAIRRGNADAQKHRKNVKQMQGAQRVALAAQGIEIDSGSAAQIQEDTRMLGEMDAMTIKNNAWREAWGYRVQAAQGRSQAEFTRMASRNEARSTLLTGGMKALSSGVEGAYYGFKK